MNKKKIMPAFLAALCAPFLTGCADHDLNGNFGEDDNAPFLEAISAVYANSPEDDADEPTDEPTEPPIDPSEDHNPATDNFEATELLDDAFHPNDVLFFSQLVSGKLVPFQGVNPDDFPGSMPDLMKETYADGYPNIYKYYYDYRYQATWEDEPGGYNFFPKELKDKMDWDHIKFWGLNNTGYALYGLYYPYNNILPQDANGNLNFFVEPDQTSLANLRKSNFIGAYHSSSKSGQRLKFRLFHLTSYLKVTLYVPVFNPHDKIINAQGKEEEIRTGFPADALQSAEVRNVYNHFRINWYGGRSSDTAPITALNTDSPRTNVLMYIPTPDTYPETNGLPPKVRVRIADYVRDADPDLPEYDECWKITLSALIPGGQDYPINDPQYPNGQTWTDLNFLRFNVRDNIGDVEKHFVFTGNSALGLIGSGDALNIGQGRIQHLSLYLPRYGEAAILLGANVIDWEDWYNSNMGLRQEDPIEPEDPPVDPDEPDEPDTPDTPDNN